MVEKIETLRAEKIDCKAKLDEVARAYKKACNKGEDSKELEEQWECAYSAWVGASESLDLQMRVKKF